MDGGALSSKLNKWITLDSNKNSIDASIEDARLEHLELELNHIKERMSKAAEDQVADANSLREQVLPIPYTT